MTGTEPPAAGSLTIVGAGIKSGLHTTQEAHVRLQRADKVLYLLAEPIPIEWLTTLNPSAESLAPLYRPGRPHGEVYEDIVTTMLSWVRRGLDVCVAFTGHPGVFDETSHDAVRRARAEGFRARILPGISAEDCLFIDLDLDPGKDGCQTFDATDFLVFGRTPDVTVPLILWQISVIGGTRTAATVDRAGLEVLAERLGEIYGPEHEVVVYEASPYPVGRPLVERCRVGGLAEADVTGMSTLFVPPKPGPIPDPAMMARLGRTPQP